MEAVSAAAAPEPTLPDIEAFCAQLTRDPDFDADELRAYDATDLLLLSDAAGVLRDIAARSQRGPGELVIIGDRHGALTLGAAALLESLRIRTHQDPVLAERALASNARRLDSYHAAGAQGVESGHSPGADEIGSGHSAGARRSGSGHSAGADEIGSGHSAGAQRSGFGHSAGAQRVAESTFTEAYQSHELGEELLTGAKLVLVQLPRGLEALTEIAWAIARYADPNVVVLAGGRDKHMSRRMNEVLAEHFTDVTAGLGWRKSRVLTATGSRGAGRANTGGASAGGATAGTDGSAPFPKWGSDPALEFQVAAFGQTFGGPTLDHGSRLLLQTLRSDPPRGLSAPAAQSSDPAELGELAGVTPADAAPPYRVVDLGCGNGVLAVSAALAWPGARVTATDQSAAAANATRVTAEAAGVGHRVTVHRGDALEAVPTGAADLILLNPPFHTGATVHAGVAHRLIRSCTGALAPGGELRIVFNSHLRYRPLVEQVIGATKELARDRTFTVLSAVKR
ncbi:class I SAM-dependent methyltransferase [Leucobacter sp. HY1910]